MIRIDNLWFTVQFEELAVAEIYDSERIERDDIGPGQMTCSWEDKDGELVIRIRHNGARAVLNEALTDPSDYSNSFATSMFNKRTKGNRWP